MPAGPDFSHSKLALFFAGYLLLVTVMAFASAEGSAPACKRFAAAKARWQGVSHLQADRSAFTRV